jgi:hypothetical protein
LTACRAFFVPPATALPDRFLHHAKIITITGRRYHLKDKAAGQADKSREQTANEPNQNHKAP